MELETILQQSLDIAKKNKIAKFDISGSLRESASSKVQDGKIESMQASNKCSITVRVWDGDKVGAAGCSDLSPSGIADSLQSAKTVASLMEQEEPVEFSPEAGRGIEIPQNTTVAVDPGVLGKRLLEVEADTRKRQPAIKSIAYNGLSEAKVSSFYVNSDQAIRKQTVSYAYCYMMAQAQKGEGKSRNGWGMHFAPDYASLECDKVVAETVDKCTRHLDYEKIKSGKYLCVFSPDAILDLLGAFSNIWNARSVLDKKSLSTQSSLGEIISSPLLTVLDDPLHAESFGSFLFDGEATPCRQVKIIDSGTLSTFLHNTATAKKMNAKLTGNAVMGAKVGVSEHFLNIQASSAEACKWGLDNAPSDFIYIDKLQALHAGIQALQGSFSLPFEGFIYRGGESKSIEQGVAAGDIKEVLKSIVNIGKGQVVTPSGTASEVWVENLSITGG